MGTIEAKPRTLRNVALRDGEEAGDAGLGREEIVAGGMDLTGRPVVADGEKLA
jgi:hypothetical protein